MLCPHKKQRASTVTSFRNAPTFWKGEKDGKRNPKRKKVYPKTTAENAFPPPSRRFSSAQSNLAGSLPTISRAHSPTHTPPVHIPRSQPQR